MGVVWSVGNPFTSNDFQLESEASNYISERKWKLLKEMQIKFNKVVMVLMLFCGSHTSVVSGKTRISKDNIRVGLKNFLYIS